MNKIYNIKGLDFVDGERYSFEQILEKINIEKSSVSSIAFLKANGHGSKDIQAGDSIKVSKYISFTLESQETNG